MNVSTKLLESFKVFIVVYQIFKTFEFEKYAIVMKLKVVLLCIIKKILKNLNAKAYYNNSKMSRWVLWL